MEKQIIKFKDSQIYKAIQPFPKVLNGVDVLESALIEKGLIDESTETMLLSSYHITYKKNGKDVLMIRPFKSDWNIKIFGTFWDVQQLFHLPVIFEFELEKTGWRLHGMLDAQEDDIKDSFLKAAQISPIKQLVVYPLSILHSYYLKNPFLFQIADEKTLTEVVSSFWEGNMVKIRKLSDESVNASHGNQISEFLSNWFEKLNIQTNLKSEQLHDRMKINIEGYKSIRSSLKLYMDNIFTNYRNSLASVWYENLILKNKEVFHAKVEENRETILLTEIFLDEMKLIDSLAKENDDFHQPNLEIISPINSLAEENTITSETKDLKEGQKDTGIINTKETLNSMGKGPITGFSLESKTKIEGKSDDWFEYIIKNGSSVREIPFRTKKDLFGEDSLISLNIYEQRVDKLVNQLAKEKRMAKEFKLMIKILIQNSNSQGFVTKEALKNLYMQEYEDERILSDFAMRYSVKKAHAHQAISSKFHVIFDQLRKHGLLKEFFRNNTFQVYWNFAVYVHQ